MEPQKNNVDPSLDTSLGMDEPAEQDELYLVLDYLMQGDFTPIGDETAPPWVELGVISQTSRLFYEHCRNNAQCSIQMDDLPAAHLFKDTDRYLLAWSEDGIHCVRGLFDQEAEQILELR